MNSIVKHFENTTNYGSNWYACYGSVLADAINALCDDLLERSLPVDILSVMLRLMLWLETKQLHLGGVQAFPQPSPSPLCSGTGCTISQGCHMALELEFYFLRVC